MPKPIKTLPIEIPMHPPVNESSMLSAIGYSEEDQVLRVQYTTGGIYDYINVPHDIAEGLRTAPSVGRYWQANIRGKFQQPQEPEESPKADASASPAA